MPKFTNEQLEAIHHEGENILVSAGAGSGKTAVLTERVLRKVKQGISMKQLLILTFTNKAAAEMKERIRKKLREENLQEALASLDSSYIMTFDAFSLSVVKKYADLLHLSKEVTVFEDSVLHLQKEAILTDIFTEYYTTPTSGFRKLIDQFCLKDDASLKKQILTLYDKLELLLDKTSFLENYLQVYYDEHRVATYVREYFQLVTQKAQDCLNLYEELASSLEGKTLEKFAQAIKPLTMCDTYEAYAACFPLTLPRLTKDCGPDAKKEKEALKEALTTLEKLLIYENIDQMQASFYQTKETVAAVLEILTVLDQRFRSYKQQHQFYTFMDIEKLAIHLVQDFPLVREELRSAFQEILIDEYQDTNDIQETFIQYIAHNNVYMVGDVKQSIYRFRNANPDIFKEKYDSYQQKKGGYAIDLTKNFRSRREVIEDINQIFTAIMDDAIGGADYQKTHAMLFGNVTYEQKASVRGNRHLQILSYQEQDKVFSKGEQEAFLIGADIKKKLKEGYQVYDQETDRLRPITYRDFVILLDRSTDFSTYKQIFEYLHLPLTLWQDEKASSGSDLGILKNLFVLAQKVARQQYDTEFFFAFTAIGRSFLVAYQDEEIYHYVVEKTFSDSSLYQNMAMIVKDYDQISPIMLLDRLLQVFHYEEKLISVGNILKMSQRMEYFYQLLSQLEASGYTIDMVTKYLVALIDSSLEIKLSVSKPETDSIKMMTIHTSKGLEYPLCYFAGFSKKFNDQDRKETVLFDRQYGMIIADDTSHLDAFTKPLLLERLKQEDVSEKIRLLYVAFTRAREQMIIVMPEVEEQELHKKVVSNRLRLQYHCFADIIRSISSLLLPRVVSYQEIPYLSKDYQRILPITKRNETSHKKLTIIPSRYEVGEVEQVTFAKTASLEQSKSEEELLLLGRKVHEILERSHLKQRKMPPVEDPLLRKKIQAFLNSDFLAQHLSDEIYQEYEFIYHQKTIEYHGKIDLLLVGTKEAIIVDYKLKRVQDKAYQKQLSGYQKVIENKLQKPVSCYLYSILEERFYPVLLEEQEAF